MKDNERNISNIKLIGWGKLEVTIKGRTFEVEEKAAPRNRTVLFENNDKPNFPVGSIDSLMPILRGPYLDFGITMEEGYWAALDDAAPFRPETACAKLRAAGINSQTVAEALLARDESFQTAIAFGNISSEQAKAIKSVVAGEVAKYYRPRIRSLT
jgi:hypothetical protein